MKNILLVDTSRKSVYSNFIPLALLKLSTKHKIAGDKVKFVKSGQAPRKHFDIIYLSTIFLFDTKKDVGFIRSYAKQYPKAKVIAGGVAVTLMLDYYKKYAGLPNVEYVTGLVPELDSFEPDYDIVGAKFCKKRCKLLK